MTDSVRAWLLHAHPRYPFAVGEVESVEYLAAPAAHAVPLAPAYAPAVIRWRDGLLPLIDLRPLLGLNAGEGASAAVVLAYQSAPRTPLRHVAVRVSETPARISVNDAQACEPPQDWPAVWRALALACFDHQGTGTPVLDVALLCTAEFRDRHGTPAPV